MASPLSATAEPMATVTPTLVVNAKTLPKATALDASLMQGTVVESRSVVDTIGCFHGQKGITRNGRIRFEPNEIALIDWRDFDLEFLTIRGDSIDLSLCNRSWQLVVAIRRRLTKEQDNIAVRPHG